MLLLSYEVKRSVYRAYFLIYSLSFVRYTMYSIVCHFEVSRVRKGLCLESITVGMMDDLSRLRKSSAPSRTFVELLNLRAWSTCHSLERLSSFD